MSMMDIAEGNPVQTETSGRLHCSTTLDADWTSELRLVWISFPNWLLYNCEQYRIWNMSMMVSSYIVLYAVWVIVFELLRLFITKPFFRKISNTFIRVNAFSLISECLASMRIFVSVHTLFLQHLRYMFAFSWVIRVILLENQYIFSRQIEVIHIRLVRYCISVHETIRYYCWRTNGLFLSTKNVLDLNE